MDDRTESLRLTGSQIKGLKVRAETKNGAVQIGLWTARHGEKDLLAIRKILAQHPGKIPVELHMQSGTGKRATITCGDHLYITKSAALEKALAPGWTNLPPAVSPAPKLCFKPRIHANNHECKQSRTDLQSVDSLSGEGLAIQYASVANGT